MEDTVPFKEGYLALHVSTVEKQCTTYYKVYGDLGCGKAPLVCLHGGPGSGSTYTQDYRLFWPRYGIPVVVYDQIGCGRSTNLDAEKAGDESFWRFDTLFIPELDNLLDHLQLRDGPGFHLWGQSTGSMLAAEFATTQPRGLQRLILGGPVASTDLYLQGIAIRKSELPTDVQQVLNQGIESGEWDTDAFRAAYKVYMRHCICRADPLPSKVEDYIPYVTSRSLLHQTVAPTMLGLCPIPTNNTIGSLRGWNIIPALHRITAKTLLWNGEFSDTHDIALQPFFDLIPRVRWHTLAGASHVVTYEGEKTREELFKLAGEFLTCDADSILA